MKFIAKGTGSIAKNNAKQYRPPTCSSRMWLMLNYESSLPGLTISLNLHPLRGHVQARYNIPVLCPIMQLVARLVEMIKKDA